MVNARRFYCFGTVLMFLGAALSARGQIRAEGYIDTNFTAICIGATSPRALAIQFDGKIIAGGNFFSPNSGCVNAIDRMNINGAPDSSFQPPFLAGDAVNAIAFQGNKLLVAGAMRANATAFPLARLTANGSLDNTFQRAIQNPSVIFNALLIQSDGRIVAAGEANVGVAGGPFGYIVRFEANGAVDPTFANGNATPSGDAPPILSALASVAGGKMLVGGSFGIYRTVTRPGLARINSDGSLDTSYVPEIFSGDVRALLVQPDGKVLVAGRFTVGVFANRALVRLNSNGTVDGNFQPLNGSGTTGLSLLLQPDGKIVLGHSFGVMRLNAEGSPDATFGPRNASQLLGTEADNVTALALTANTNLIVGAQRVYDGTSTRYGVARLFAFIPPLPPPPVIVQQPLTHFVETGTNVTFSVIATGAPPLRYQWRKNGANVPRATNDTLAFTNVNSTHTANYTVVVSNPGGSVTSVVARLSVSFQTDTLVLITNGIGAVLPNLTRQPLEIGRAYTITARPAVGNLFSNWTGGVTSSAPVLTFVMQSNLTIVVNFVPSPFIPVKGVYNGLFFNTGAPAHESAGALALTLDDKGGIRGSVRMGTRLRKFTGAFSVERTATVALPATATAPALFLALEIDVVNAIITGSVSFGTNASTNSSALLAYRNPFSSRSLPAPTAGNYNAALPGVDDPEVAPAGDGFAALTVSTAGRVSGGGALADGTMFKVLSATAANAQVPVYVPLYLGRGSLFGWLTVTNGEISDVSGTLWWIKPGTVGRAFYPAGFSNQVEVIGSRYIAPARGTPVLTLANGVVILSGGNFAPPLTNSITLGGDNKIVGDNQLTLTISPVKGSVTGSFVDPAVSRKRTVKGVALPKQNQARGFFLGTDQSGRVFVGEAP
jgi:uncharacterized delta-60 repeat protein